MAKSAKPDWEGQDRFVIERCLGAGGMGVVYAAYDRERDVRVALKTLQHLDPTALYRFKQEFRKLADVVHPNLVSLFELGELHQRWFFTMELVEGVDFLQYVRGTAIDESAITVPDDDDAQTIEDGALGAFDDEGLEDDDLDDEADGAGRADLAADGAESNGSGELLAAGFASVDLVRLRDALAQLTEGVMALHRAGRLHRDIKPSNVLVTSAGRVVLLDFGLVTELASDLQSIERNLVGTALYMSPEQAANLPLSEASDWYSVGVMLYEALTGRVPFPGRNIVRVLTAKVREDPRPAKELDPAIPDDLDDLCMELIRRAPIERPTGEQLLARLGFPLGYGGVGRPVPRPSDEAMLYRSRPEERAALLSAFEKSRTQPVQVVTVAGPSGMGKSSLVSGLADELAESHGALVLRGRCYRRDLLPYKGLDGLIDSLSRFLRNLDEGRASEILPSNFHWLARLFPVLRRSPVVAREVAEHLDEDTRPEWLRPQALIVLRELLRRLAADRPVVVVIDDLHWMDVESAGLLAELVAPPSPPPVLLLLLYRSGLGRDAAEGLGAFLEALSALDAEVERTHLELGPLDSSTARRMALGLMASSDSPARARANAVARESGGHPLHLCELVRYLDDIDQLSARVSRRRDVTLDEVLRARLEVLPAGARRVLDVLAVAGKPIEPAVAAPAARVGDDPLGAFNLLASHQLIHTLGPLDEERIEISQNRVRELLVQWLSPERRQMVHGRLAKFLERRGAPPEDLVIHYLAAGNTERACYWATQAASDAADRLAFDRAQALYQLAIENCAGDPALLDELAAKLDEITKATGRHASVGDDSSTPSDDTTPEERPGSEPPAVAEPRTERSTSNPD